MNEKEGDTEKPLISVVIPNHNGAAVLPTMLRSLAKQSLSSDEVEVILVDDGSTDGSLELATECRLPYPLIVLKQGSAGPGAARNRGAAQARGKVLVFLDADMICAPDLLQHYGTAHLTHPQALVIGRQSPWSTSFRSLFEEVTGYELNRDLGAAPMTVQFYHVCSGSLLIGRESFLSLGGFDEDLKRTQDTDLGYRAVGAGMELVYWPQARVYHNHFRTLDARCRQIYWSAFWTAKLFRKHPEMSNLVPIFRDVQPVSWGSDSFPLLCRKLIRRILSFGAMRWTVV